MKSSIRAIHSVRANLGPIPDRNSNLAQKPLYRTYRYNLGACSTSVGDTCHEQHRVHTRLRLLGPKGEGTPNTDVDIAINAALEDASLKNAARFHHSSRQKAPPSGEIRRTGAAPAKENGVVRMASKLMASHASNKLYATILPTFANVLKPNHLAMPASKVRSPVDGQSARTLGLNERQITHVNLGHSFQIGGDVEVDVKPRINRAEIGAIYRIDQMPPVLCASAADQ